MAAISKGTTFATGDQVTALSLNNLVDNSTFASGAVDNTSTQLSSGAIIVKDGGVTTAKLNDGAVITAKLNDGAVTKPKMENVANMKVLGNTSGSATSPQEVAILDEDTMSSDSATSLATQQSIKAYVDGALNFSPSSYAGEESVTFPNGLIMKFGEASQTGSGGTVTYGAAFPNEVISVCVTPRDIASRSSTWAINGSSASAFTWIANPNHTSIYWQAIGR